jgi:hypothetical protein
MEEYEDKLKKMIKKSQGFSQIEFFFEQDELKNDIQKMMKELNKQSCYMPKYNLKNVDDIENVKKAVREKLQAKLDENIITVDNSFALENYEYTTNELCNE